MLVPTSGKTGFLIFGTEEIPIYSWAFSSARARDTYRTVSSQNYPRRTAGIVTEQIVIQGVHTSIPFSLSQPAGFLLGWNDLSVPTRRTLPCNGMISEIKIDFNYFSSTIPSFMWTTSLMGIVNTKLLGTAPFVPQEDYPVCAHQLCNKTITTSDSSLNSGLVKHVRNASIITTVERQPYVVAGGNNRYKNITGVFDRILELTLEGDFDYWNNRLVNTDNDYDYKFFFGPLITDYILAARMKILDIGNFMVNVLTGQLVRMTVRLGASYD